MTASAGRPGRVLLTDGEFKHTLGIARALHARGHEVHLVVRSRRAPAAHSRAVARTHFAPPPADASFAARLAEIARTLAPVSLVPVGDGSVRAAEALRGTRATLGNGAGHGIALALPPPASLALANDKAKTGEFARSLGVATPGERVATTLEEALAAYRALGPVVVVKGRHEAGVKQLRYVRREADVAAAFAVVRDASGEGPLVQQYVAGEGVAFFALYWDGRPRLTFMHRRIREWPPSGGSSTCAESLLNEPALDRAGRALLDALAWHGVAMVEMKRAADGRLVLMEINAKFWGSHDLALAAGVDMPGELVALLEGREAGEGERAAGESGAAAPAPRRVRFSWPLGGDLWHGLARPSALPRVLFDALWPGVAHSARLSDPIPLLYEVVQCVRSTPGAFRQWRETR
ncbi:MAG: hypothetical protein ACREOU_00230 [Candidatus Eiseniibacteriota bacterium]